MTNNTDVNSASIDMLDIQSVDTGSHLELYKEYAREEMMKGNENFDTFTEFRDKMNS